MRVHKLIHHHEHKMKRSNGMGWQKKRRKKEWKQARERTKAQGKAAGTDRGLGSGSGYSSHKADCHMLTFLYVIGKGYGLLSGLEIRTVIEYVGDREIYTDPKTPVQDRVCGCGLQIEVLGTRWDGTVLESWGENLGDIMKTLFGPIKQRELQARMQGKNFQDD